MILETLILMRQQIPKVGPNWAKNKLEIFLETSCIKGLFGKVFKQYVFNF